MADEGLFTDSDRSAVEAELAKLRGLEYALFDVQGRAGALARDVISLRERLEAILGRGKDSAEGVESDAASQYTERQVPNTVEGGEET